MSINIITFGNPTVTQKHAIETTTYLDYLFSKFQNYSWPANNSDTTKTELNQIAEFLGQIQLSKNKDILENYILFDKNIGQAIINIFKNKGLDLTELVYNIIHDVSPLVLKLKYFYNRPRPTQLANVQRLKLFPFDSKSSNTPSYPSMHTTLGIVILKTIASKYPEYDENCNNAIDIIAYSRIYLGLNYQSDNDFSIEIADEILQSKKFTTKYDI